MFLEGLFILVIAALVLLGFAYANMVSSNKEKEKSLEEKHKKELKEITSQHGEQIHSIKSDRDSQFKILRKSILKSSLISNYPSRKIFETKCKELAKDICKIFEVEYCCIGLIKNGLAIDYASEVYGDKDQACSKTLEKSQKIPIKETLVGQALASLDYPNQRYWMWEYNKHQRYLSNDDIQTSLGIKTHNIDEYRKHVLYSNNFYNIIVLGIYDDEDTLIGYINLVNKLDNSREPKKKFLASYEIETLELVADNLAVIFEKNELQKAINKDEAIVNSWYQINDVDKLFNSILKYLNKEFNSIVASYWVSAHNGFDNNDKIIALRAYHLDNEHNRLKNYLEENKESDVIGSLSGKIITNELEGKQDEIRFIDWAGDNIDIVWKNVPTPHVIGIPIMKSPEPNNNNDLVGSQNPEDKIWGVICLQPKVEIANIEETSVRLKDFAKHVQILIEKVIYKRRFYQIKKLNQALENLTLDKDEQGFYDNITEIIRDCVDAEACSIFLKHRNRNDLYLKSSTAKEFKNDETKEILDKEKYIKEQIKVYPLEGHTSITARVYKEKKPVMVYNLDKCADTYRIFMEQSKTDHKSLIAMPLMTAPSEEVFGVVRCINKEKNQRLLHVFVEGDLELLKVIGGILTGYIKYKEYDEIRNTALSHFAHENRGPISGLEYSLEILKMILVRDFGKMTNDVSTKMYDMASEIEVLKNNIQNTENMYLEKNRKRQKYDYEKCDMKKLTKRIAELLRGKNSVNVIANTSKSPELFVDEKTMHQVFYNLISNAVNYSKSGTTVEIFYNQDENYPNWHRYDIQNWGIGVPEGEERKIFDVKNYRAYNAIEKRPTGTGIGLKVCKEILEQHGGKVEVTKSHQPTVFTVFLPSYLTNKKPNI